VVGDEGCPVVAFEAMELQWSDVSDEEVVDNVGVTAPGVKGSLVVGDGCCVASDFQMSLLFERAEDVVVDGAVHVATQDDGYACGYKFVDESAEEKYAFTSGYRTHVVEVCVEIGNLLTGLLLLKKDVGYGSTASSVPTQ